MAQLWQQEGVVAAERTGRGIIYLNIHLYTHRLLNYKVVHLVSLTSSFQGSKDLVPKYILHLAQKKKHRGNRAVTHVKKFNRRIGG